MPSEDKKAQFDGTEKYSLQVENGESHEVKGIQQRWETAMVARNRERWRDDGGRVGVLKEGGWHAGKMEGGMEE